MGQAIRCDLCDKLEAGFPLVVKVNSNQYDVCSECNNRFENLVEARKSESKKRKRSNKKK